MLLETLFLNEDADVAEELVARDAMQWVLNPVRLSVLGKDNEVSHGRTGH